jgi:uncharacterized protein
MIVCLREKSVKPFVAKRKHSKFRVEIALYSIDFYCMNVVSPSQTLDWHKIRMSLHENGFAFIPHVLTESDCKGLQGLYSTADFRSTINMERYRFGKGEYKYFNYPLPQVVSRFRELFYQPLAPLANEWMQVLDEEMRFPNTHQELIEHCHNKKQLRPTPLILRYEKGGYNTLHQDLY